MLGALALAVLIETALISARALKRSSELKTHAAALLLILIAQTACNGIVSPLSWDDPIAALSKLESIQLGATSPMLAENLINAKALDFSGFSHAFWGGAPDSPMAAFSYGVAALAWILDPALVDVAAFFRLAQILMFLWCVAGCFGFYLFCRRGLGLRTEVATAAAAALPFANPFFAVQLKDYFPLFVGVMLTLPWTLWLIEAGDAAHAYAAGLIFCGSFYILPQHPETVLHGLAFLAAYSLFLTARDLKRTSALALGLLAGVCAYALPVLWALHSGDLRVFGHLDAPRWAFSLKGLAMTAAAVGTALVAPRFIAEPARKKRFAFFLWSGAALILCRTFMRAASAESAAAAKAAADYLILRQMRLGSYLAFSAFTAALFAVDAGFKALGRKYSRAFLAALTIGAVCLGSSNYKGGPKLGPPHFRAETLRVLYRALGREDAASLRFMAAEEQSGARQDSSHPLWDIPYAPRDNAYTFKPDFDLAASLSGLDGRFHRILAATAPETKHIGAVAGGVFLNDGVLSSDTRFMSIYPPLQKIYLVPGENFAGPGNYSARSACAITMEEVLAPSARKLLNIAGIDAYVFNRALFRLRAGDKDLQLNESPQDLGLVAAFDERSYGMAYFAREIRVAGAPPSQDQLLALPGKHAIFLEDSSRAGQTLRASSANRLTIENIAGNKAAFKTRCERAPCVLVFNTAAVGGWRAFAEGEPLAVMRANAAFLAVEAPLGEHMIWFERRPVARLAGALMTLAGALVGLLWLGAARKQKSFNFG